MFLQNHFHLKNFEIPESNTKTEKGDNYLLNDSVVESPIQRIIIFGTEAIDVSEKRSDTNNVPSTLLKRIN